MAAAPRRYPGPRPALPSGGGGGRAPARCAHSALFQPWLFKAGQDPRGPFPPQAPPSPAVDFTPRHSHERQAGSSHLRGGRGLPGGLAGGDSWLRCAGLSPGDPGEAGDGALGDPLHALAGGRGCVEGRPRPGSRLRHGHRCHQGGGVRHRGALDRGVQRGGFPAAGGVGQDAAAQGRAPEGAVGGRGADLAGRALQGDPV
ncbi:guanidinoacetate N-methyltransferase isoform 2-T2 [Rhynochetos jubatus]